LTGAAKHGSMGMGHRIPVQERNMISLFKALIPGALLTWIVSSVIGSNGSKGGFLYIHHLSLTGHGAFEQASSGIYWSWPLFFAGTGLAFALFKMQE
jgi:hypothetical protein